MNPVTPSAPAPTNGAAPKATQGQPAPKPTDTATGPQTPSGQPRAPDGKFAPQKQGEGAAQPPAPVKVKLKDLELDEEAAYREIQRGRQSSKLLAEAEKRAKAAEERDRAWAARQAALKEGRFDELFAESGLSPEEAQQRIAEWYYKRHVEPAQLTEDQRKLREAEERAAKLEADLKAKQDAETQAEEARLVEQAQADLEQEVMAAMEAGKVPKARAVLRKVTARMLRFESKGLKVPLEEHVRAVREESAKETGEVVSTAEVAHLRELWGDEVFKPVLMKFVEYAKGLLAPRQESAPKAAPYRKPAQPVGRLSPQEFKTKFK